MIYYYYDYLNDIYYNVDYMDIENLLTNVHQFYHNYHIHYQLILYFYLILIHHESSFFLLLILDKIYNYLFDMMDFYIHYIHIILLKFLLNHIYLYYVFLFYNDVQLNQLNLVNHLYYDLQKQQIRYFYMLYYILHNHYHYYYDYYY